MNAMENASDQLMFTAFEKLKEGLTTPEEVLRITQETQEND